MAAIRLAIAGWMGPPPGTVPAVTDTTAFRRPSSVMTAGSASTPSALKKVQCSMVSTPAVMASAMPCPPCACAATGSPRECALCTAATSSVAVYCDSCGPSDGVKFPRDHDLDLVDATG